MIDTVRRIVGDAKTYREVRRNLDAAGLMFQDATEESGYLNFRIPVFDGYYRVCQFPGREIEVRFHRVEKLECSGIPTFEPSGRWSL